MEDVEDAVVRDWTLVVVGLGYVGLPLAVAFSQHLKVIGLDRNRQKIESYQSGQDPTREVGSKGIRECSVIFSSDETCINEADVVIVAVPTPVKPDKTPDLTPVLAASDMIGRNLRPGTLVIYESTVFPGVTEDVCVPLIELRSGLKMGPDFTVGYSPERINPGDQIHRLDSIVKVVAGCDDATTEIMAEVYGMVVKAGVHRVSSIRAAEAIKVVENSQRDINIAFMNELAMVFDRMGIDTNEVIDGMNTKWNALGFRPGLVGGHCIGVDPYYLLYGAERLGFHSQIIAGGRRVNSEMGIFVADVAVKHLIAAGKRVRGSRVAVLGVTFKENCPDIRNSRVKDVMDRLGEFGVELVLVDPVAEHQDVLDSLGVELRNLSDVRDVDCVLLAVAHTEFGSLSPEVIAGLFRETSGPDRVVIDVKGQLSRTMLEEAGFTVWRL